MTCGAVVAALMLVGFATGWGLIGWMFFVGGIYYGMKRFRNEAGGNINYVKALYTGTQTAFFTSLILAFAGYVTTTLDPTIIPAILDMMAQRLRAASVPQAIAEAVVQQWREILSPLVISMLGVCAYTIAGFVIAAVAAAFVQNSNETAAR